MHKTRLAIIRKNYRPDGGAERIIERMLSQLQRHYQLEISLLTQEWKSDHDSAMNIINLPKHGWTRTARFKSFIEETQVLLQKHPFDIVQSHERVPGCQIYRAGDGVHKEWIDIRCKESSQFKCKTLRASRFHRAVINAERALFYHQDLEYVICNSRQIKNEILFHYPEIPQSRIRVIHNGINLGHFTRSTGTQRQSTRTQLGLLPDDPVLISVGSGFYRKGVATTLRALAETPAWKLIIVGKEKEQKRYQKLCNDLGVRKRVFFVGVQQDVRPFYAAADLLAHPALYDPFPNVVLEAMACGIGIITSDKCGASEVISEGENGYVIPPGEHLQLGRILEQCNDHDMLQQLGGNAYQTAMHFTVERMTDSLVSLYASILEKR
ncbi:MAG TPA: glycosyl transferase family 1 [Gammaproteobacteria bacterium]|nr:glycosyl transferase family 1 [Gammaproteobacteria bacterium]